MNLIGENISHYKILEHLGGGGIGVVYKTEDTKFNRKVALKFLPSHLTIDEETRTKFHREAAADLSHPNIITVYEMVLIKRGTQ